MKEHAAAFWGGVAAFASNVVALKIVDALNGREVWRFVGIFVASLCVGAAVYARERMADARVERIDQARREHWVVLNEEKLEAAADADDNADDKGEAPS